MAHPRRKLYTAAGGLLAAACVVGGGIALRGHQPPADAGPAAPPQGAAAAPARVPAAVVRPRRDPAFQVTINQFATVEAFYQADLRTRASGVVKRVVRDIGEKVRKGDLLVEIDAPDLDADVEQKEAVIAQRGRELRVSEAGIANAAAMVEVAHAAVRQRQADVAEAEATKAFRGKRLDRYRLLASRQAVNDDIVDENQQQYASAAAAAESAKAAVDKALADLKEKESSLAAAGAEVELKTALVEVARKDRDKALALAEFARVYAPFDGVVVRREVDPGSFVQNATTAKTEPLVTVARVDEVTLVCKVPDNAAPFVGRGTPAEFTSPEYPGVVIKGHVTRHSPSIETGDRTMRVEVDLFTGTDAEYASLWARNAAGGLACLAGSRPEGVALLAATGLWASQQGHKGSGDGVPPRPVILGAAGGRKLLPGMTGYLRLFLDRFGDAYLLPSSSVYTRGGQRYVLVVEKGKTRQVPVKVQVDDGRVVKLTLARPGGGFAELTGTEQVVASRQLEVGDGQEVEAAVKDW